MEAGASVEIPTANNPDAKKPKKDPITVSVTKDGQVFIEKSTTGSANIRCAAMVPAMPPAIWATT